MLLTSPRHLRSSPCSPEHSSRCAAQSCSFLSPLPKSFSFQQWVWQGYQVRQENLSLCVSTVAALLDCLTGTGGRTSSQDAQGSALTSKKGFCPLLSPRIALNQVNHPSRELASPIYFSLCLDQLSKIKHVHVHTE